MQKCVYTPIMQDQARKPDLPEGIEAALFCACFNLRKTARAITQFYNTILQPSGLLATQFTLLAILARDNPTPISALADVLGMDRTTLARNLKPLQRDGLVQVAPDDTDHRIQLVTPTTEGRAALLAALPLWQQAQQQIVGQLGAERWHTLLADLSGIVTLTQP
jgi:DNA-binding MarR family transcriptional regulator